MAPIPVAIRKFVLNLKSLGSTVLGDDGIKHFKSSCPQKQMGKRIHNSEITNLYVNKYQDGLI